MECPCAVERTTDPRCEDRGMCGKLSERDELEAALRAICALNGRHDLIDAQKIARAALTKGEHQ